MSAVPVPIVGRTASSVAEVVESGLCVGCGLCEAIAPGTVRMQMSEVGAWRPMPVDAFTPEQEAEILRSCPGVVAPGGGAGDRIWGSSTTMAMAWSAEPGVRFRSATGGVLTGLGRHLLASGRAEAILHVGPDPEAPMRNRWVISRTPDEVLANAGSRYGPTAPLAGLNEAIALGVPFAVIAKPCDVGAVRRRALDDPRLAELLVATAAMVCGGQSRITKSVAVLDDLAVDEDDVSLFRYRGYGNPGPTRIETRSGDAHEIGYLEMWEDESGWDLDARCTICPDALGEVADIAAADAWPGGAPTGEDEGFNAIVVHTEVGEELVRSAVDAGMLVLGDDVTPAEFDHLQPHQVRKKRALVARFEGRAAAGLPTIATPGLRLEACAAELPADDVEREIAGTKRRAEAGRYTETAVRLTD